MHKNIEIARNDQRKSLPDVACNEAEDTFFAVWAAAPGENSQSADYRIGGLKISSAGEALGPPVEVLKTDDILMLPHVLHNPNKNQYLVTYCRAESYFNIRGVFLNADGTPAGQQFTITDAPANQFHYTMALNTRRNQFLVVYNDFRDGAGNSYGVIIDDRGILVKGEFLICAAPGHQINPVACYNPENDTYLVNWEDFRAHGNDLEPLGTLEVMTDIYGVLLSGDGAILKADIEMCADAAGANADQRFNGIAYNPNKNEFLTSWTDTRESVHNVGIIGRIVKPDGSMPDGDFPLVDLPGAQMLGHCLYVPGEDAYFIALECDKNNVDKFYFKDIHAKLDIGALWLDGAGRPASPMIDIFRGTGNQRFARVAHSPKSGAFLLVWQSDFPGVSDSVEGHIMSAGGDILGAVYKK
jgi:hypothetical protein